MPLCGQHGKFNERTAIARDYVPPSLTFAHNLGPNKRCGALCTATKQYTGENHTDEVCGSLSRLIVQVALEYLPRGCEATWPRKAEEGEAGVGAGATLNALACACSCSALPRGSAQARGVRREGRERSKAGQWEYSVARVWLATKFVRLVEASHRPKHPGAGRCRASPALGIADHSVIEFLLPGSWSGGASPACSVADHPWVGFMHPGS